MHNAYHVSPCNELIQITNKVSVIEERTEDLPQQIHTAFMNIRRDFDVFRRWIIGIFLISVMISTVGSIWKINVEFREVRMQLHDIEIKIIKQQAQPRNTND